jgi:hypothetical protein
MQPQSPNKDFDFIMKDNPQQSRGSILSKIPKPAKIATAAVLGIFLLIVIVAIFSGHKKGNTQEIVGVLARGQETLRVTDAVGQLQLKDPQTQALAATVSSTLTSDQSQITNYLAKNHVKVTPQQLASNQDKTTDSSLQTASQNNSLDSAYINYLKAALAKYQSDLQAAYKSAGLNGKAILQESFNSTNTLLATAPLKS